MKAVDSSVVVAAFATWHEFHAEARDVVDERPRVVGHSALEAFSVLTRLPPPHRVEPEPVRDFLQQRFAEPPLTLAARRYRAMITRLTGHGITGGAVYDALIAVVATEHKATLWTCDRRAARTYERIGATVEFVGAS